MKPGSWLSDKETPPLLVANAVVGLEGLSRASARTARVGIWLLLTLLAAYLLTFSGRLTSIDEVSILAVTENLVKHGEFQIDQIYWMQHAVGTGMIGPDGQLYSKHSLLQSLVLVPLYWLALALPDVGNVQVILLLPPLVTAATALVVFLSVVRLGYRPGVAVATALIYGLATIAFPFSRTLFSEPLSGFLLSLAVLSLISMSGPRPRTWVLVLGLSLGLAALAKPTNVLVGLLFWPVCFGRLGARASRPRGTRAGVSPALPELVVVEDQVSTSPELDGPAVVSRLRRLGTALSDSRYGLLAWTSALALLLGYNYLRFRDPLVFGYPQWERFDGDLLAGAYGLLISPGRGLLAYCPVLLLSFGGLFGLARRDRAVALSIVGALVIFIVLFGRWYVWWGSLGWGPRFMVPVVPLLCIPLAAALASWTRWPRILRGVGVALIALSLAIQLLAVVVVFEPYYLHLSELGGSDWPGTPLVNDIARSPLLGQLGYIAAGYSDLLWWTEDGLDVISLGVLALGVLFSLSLLLLSVRGRAKWLHGRSGAVLAAVTLMWLGAGASLMLARHASSERFYTNDKIYGVLRDLQRRIEPGDVVWSIYPYSYPLTTTWYKASNRFFGFDLSTPSGAAAPPAVRRLDPLSSRVWIITDERQGISRQSGPGVVYGLLASGDMRLSTARPGLWLVEPLTRDGELPAERSVTFGDSIRLSALQVRPDPAASGRVLVQLRWRSVAPAAASYTVFAHLIDSSGARVAQSDRLPIDGLFPTSDWPTGLEVSDEITLTLPQTFSPGRYELFLGLYQVSTGKRLRAEGPWAVKDQDGAAVNVWIGSSADQQ